MQAEPAVLKVTPPPIGVRVYLNPVHLCRALWSQRSLIIQFTRREVSGRYRGSYLGILWSCLNPLVLLLTYTFVFGLVFKARWPQARPDSLGEFAVILFAGLIVYNVFSECVSRAPGLILAVPNYVKKVVFPLEILMPSVLGAALFHALINLLILVLAHALISRTLHPLLLVWTPLLAVPLAMLTLGCGWFFASLGVYIRDIQQVVTLALMVLFFCTPIFYPLAAIPEPFQTALGLNPLAVLIENFRRAVLWGQPLAWRGLAGCTAAAAVIMVLGYAFFMKTKKGFADVL